jgi:hypothetical protein
MEYFPPFVENISKTNHKLAELYKDDASTEIWNEIGKGLKKRS